MGCGCAVLDFGHEEGCIAGLDNEEALLILLEVHAGRLARERERLTEALTPHGRFVKDAC